jgi:hypothetical protein
LTVCTPEIPDVYTLTERPASTEVGLKEQPAASGVLEGLWAITKYATPATDKNTNATMAKAIIEPAPGRNLMADFFIDLQLKY